MGLRATAGRFNNYAQTVNRVTERARAPRHYERDVPLQEDRMSTIRGLVIASFVVSLAGLPGAGARAGDFTECRLSGGASPETLIAACTAAIASGTLGQRDLAAALVSRGAGLRSLHRDDDAFEDFDRAILWDPLCSAAYHERGLLHLYRGEIEWAHEDFGMAARIEQSGADSRVEEF